VLAVGVAAHAAFVGGAVGRKERQAVTGLHDVLQGLDGRSDGGGVKRGTGAGAGVQDELRGLHVGRFVGALAKIGWKRRVCVCDNDALAEIAAGGFAQGDGLGVGDVVGASDMEASDAAVEPEAGDVGEVGGGDSGIEVEENADVAAAGLVDEVVEVVECAQGGIDRLGVGRIGLDGGEEERVGAEGVDVVEALRDAVEAGAVVGVEVCGIYLIDDGVLPPEVGGDAGADPARAGESLRKRGRR